MPSRSLVQLFTLGIIYSFALLCSQFYIHFPYQYMAISALDGGTCVQNSIAVNMFELASGSLVPGNVMMILWTDAFMFIVDIDKSDVIQCDQISFCSVDTMF